MKAYFKQFVATLLVISIINHYSINIGICYYAVLVLKRALIYIYIALDKHMQAGAIDKHMRAGAIDKHMHAGAIDKHMREENNTHFARSSKLFYYYILFLLFTIVNRIYLFPYLGN